MQRKLIFLFISVIVLTSAFSNEYAKSSLELEKSAKKNYSSKDKVLYYLDSGMLNYYEGNYSATVEKLSDAENLIEDYYTKSVSQNTAALLTNDSAIEYPGEDYEDIYLNLFKALAYYNAGKWQEGFHELNAYKRKASVLSNRHTAELEKARALANSDESYDVNISFHDSALAEYLFLIYYRRIKDANQVNYAGRMLKDVFKTSSDIYNFRVPQSINEELTVKPSDTRLNFVVFSGLSPQKVEDTEYYSNELVLSLPELEIPKANVRFVNVKATNKANGKIYEQNLEQIENLGNIFEDVFKAKSKVIYYKSVARAMLKGSGTAASSVAGDVLSDSDSTVLSVLGGLLSAASVANENATAATEHADLRCSKYFPGRADVGGITVEPGTYTILVSYYDVKGGNLLYQKQVGNVKASSGALNLVTASSILDEIKAAEKNQSRKNTQNEKRIVSVYDTVEEDKLYFDIGTEPESSASTTYGLIQYNWNKTYASSFKIKYSSSTETEDEIDGYTNAVEIIKNKTFEADLFPFIFKIGNAKKFSFNVGLSYQYTNLKDFAGMFDTNGYMLDEGDEGKYFTMDNKKTAHFFAPRIGATGKIPINKYLGLGFEVYANPIYFMYLDQSLNYHSDQTTEPFNYSGENSVKRWSSPFAEAKVYADCFTFARFVTSLSYQRLDFQVMDWSKDFESLVGYDDMQQITTLRFGLELLAGNKKRARVRGGIYYQNEWNKSSYYETTDRKDKWIISIGTER